MTALATPGTATRKRPDLRSILPFTGAITVFLSLLFFTTQSPQFLTGDNVLNILVQGSVVAIGAFGLAVVVIGGGDNVVTGGIDLSIGAVMGLTGSLLATRLAQGDPFMLAILIALGGSLLCGAVNAGFVTLGVRPLLTTLAMMGIVTSADLLISNNGQISVTDAALIWLRDGRLFGIPAPVIVLFVLFVITWVIVDYSKTGVRLYAVGGNPIAAKVAGLRTSYYIAGTYIFSAFCGATAGVLLTARSSGSTPGAGSPLLLDIILAAFISVIFSKRLVVNLVGTLVGALFVAALTNGFTLINVPTFWVSGVKGALILIVVAISALRGRKTVS